MGELMDTWQREGIDGIRPKIDLVVDTALSWDRHPDQVRDGRAILFRFGTYVVAVVDAYMGDDGYPAQVSDVYEAQEIAGDAARERGHHEWLDEVVPLYRVREKED